MLLLAYSEASATTAMTRRVNHSVEEKNVMKKNRTISWQVLLKERKPARVGRRRRSCCDNAGNNTDKPRLRFITKTLIGRKVKGRCQSTDVAEMRHALYAWLNTIRSISTNYRYNSIGPTERQTIATAAIANPEATGHAKKRIQL